MNLIVVQQHDQRSCSPSCVPVCTAHHGPFKSPTINPNRLLHHGRCGYLTEGLQSTITGLQIQSAGNGVGYDVMANPEGLNFSFRVYVACSTTCDPCFTRKTGIESKEAKCSAVIRKKSFTACQERHIYFRHNRQAQILS